MPVHSQHYELPLHGDQFVPNAIIASALAAMGVGGKPRRTEHRRKGKYDWEYYSFHLSTGSLTFPELSTVALIQQLAAREINMAGPWPDHIKLFLAAWLACTSRKTFLHAVQTPGLSVHELQMIRCGEGLCSMELPRQGNLEDLRVIAKTAGEKGFKVSSRIAAWALITVGFAPLIYEGDGITFTQQSLTFPGLTVAMCLEGYQKIKGYNDSLLAGFHIVPSPPEIDLPGAPPGKHPFQFALQGLLNYAQIMDWIKPKTPGTLAFLSDKSSTRMGIISATADPKDIEIAQKHSRA